MLDIFIVHEPIYIIIKWKYINSKRGKWASRSGNSSNLQKTNLKTQKIKPVRKFVNCDTARNVSKCVRLCVLYLFISYIHYFSHRKNNYREVLILTGFFLFCVFRDSIKVAIFWNLLLFLNHFFFCVYFIYTCDVSMC